MQNTQKGNFFQIHCVTQLFAGWNPHIPFFLKQDVPASTANQMGDIGCISVLGRSGEEYTERRWKTYVKRN